MTLELRQQLAQQARSLQLRLSHGRVDPVTAAAEAKRLFTEAADAERARWLSLEISGYVGLVSSTPIHALLGLPALDRLANQVAAYRTQRGVVKGREPQELSHFFVEPLGTLVATRAHVAEGGGVSSIVLHFGPQDGDTSYPRLASFSGDVFDRIVGGFVDALHLQLGTLTT